MTHYAWSNTIQWLLPSLVPLTPHASRCVILLVSCHDDTQLNFAWVRARHIAGRCVHVDLTVILTIQAETVQVRLYSIYNH